MQARPLTSALVLLSLAFAFSPARGETSGKLAVAVLPNTGDLANTDGALFSPDGRIVATLDSSSRSVTLWDMVSGRPLRTLEYEAYFGAVAFAPDSKWIGTGHRDGKIKLWDVTTGAVMATLQPPSRTPQDEDADSVTSLWVDGKGDVLVSGTESGAITLWSVADRKPLRSFDFGKLPDKSLRARVVAVRLTADGSRVIAATDGSVKVFDASLGKETVAFDLPNHYPMWENKDPRTFAKGGIIADDGLIVRHSAPDCKVEEILFLSLKDPANLVTVDKPASCGVPDDDGPREATIYTSPSQPSVVIARPGVPELKQWDSQTRNVTRTIKWGDGPSDKIIGLDRDFELAVSLDGDKAFVREFAGGKLLHTLTSYDYAADNAVASRDGRVIMMSPDLSPPDPKQKAPDPKILTLWQVGALSPKSVHVPDGQMFIQDFAPAAMRAVGTSEKGEVILFSTETGSEQRRFSVAGLAKLTRARLSPNGKLVALVGWDDDDKQAAVLVSADDGAVRLRFKGRDDRNGMLASTGSDDPNDLVTTAAFSPDGASVAVGRFNGTAEVWSTQSLRRLKTLAAEKDGGDQIWSLAFSTDGRRLIGGTRDSGVYLWDLATGRLVRSFERDSLAGHVHVASVAMSHDGRLVVAGASEHAVSSGDTGPEHGIKVWNAATGKLLFTLRGHDGGVGAVTFSSDDQWLVSGSFDGTIKYWNRTTGKPVATFASVADGRWIVVTEGGFFAGSPGSDDLINVVRGLKSVPAASFHDQLYRPDLVEQLLKGDHDHRYAAAVRSLDLEKAWDSQVSP